MISSRRKLVFCLAVFGALEACSTPQSSNSAEPSVQVSGPKIVPLTAPSTMASAESTTSIASAPTPPPPPPKPVESGDVFLGGAAGPAPRELPAVLARARDGFRRCYQAALKDDPTVRGSLHLTVRIGPNGEVTSVEPAASALPPSLGTCAASVLEDARFAPPEGGGAVVAVPITFSDAIR